MTQAKRQTIVQAQAGASAPTSGDIALYTRVAGAVHAHSLPIDFVAAYHGTIGEGLAATVRHVLGMRSTFVGGVLNDLCEFMTTSATFPELTGAEPLQIVSTSSQDAPGGTGTSVVEVTYISADSGSAYHERVRRITLNGLTPVPCSFTAHAIQHMEATSGGADEVSVGDITLRHTNSTGLLYEQITAGGNKSLSGRYMVPDSHSAFLQDWDGGAINQDMDLRLRATVTTTSREAIGRYLFQATARTALNTRFEENLPYLKCPARSRIKVSAIPAATVGSPRCDVNFAIIVLQENGAEM